MLIGVPGSGKSTWIANNADHVDAQENLFIASTDDLIEAHALLEGKTYNEVFKDYIKSAEKGMYMDLALATANDMDIIWDQTNLTRKSRAKKLIMIPDHYLKIAQFFPVPEKEELERRLASRLGKTIPSHIIESMRVSVEFPCLSEGFHQIVSHGEYTL
jgi:predicted kinase